MRYDTDDLEAAAGSGKAGAPTRGKLDGPAGGARIEQLLKAGQTIVCQVTKNPIGTKGARLTQEVSLPGRFVVLVPNSDTYGISKRLADDERKRLRRILDEIRPEGHGLIVRTAAEGATPDELRRDVARLLGQWQRIEQLAQRQSAPALLYRGDVRFDRDDMDETSGASGGGRARIEELLRPGQTILCQVTKNPIGTKGARLTQEVSLAGRFMVLLPGSSTYGISKRLADDERKRLRRILDDVRSEGNGLIVRTAAEGATPEELRRDVERLQRQWAQIEQKAKRKGAPALLYREPPLAVRVIREEFNKDYRGVVIDDPELHGEVHDYVAALIPELADRIELYDDPTLPLFERQHIHEQLHKALDRKVWLP
ncbi:MAG: ribonuclease E/G, partial [Acidimicrobiales bacterium]